MIYYITPVPKPRMTKRDKWKKRPCVMRYRAFCDECRLKGLDLPIAGASVIFHVPMPKSWTAKKKRSLVGSPHMQKPDLSNLLKALEDAVHEDDSKIWHYKSICKYWDWDGAIEIK